MSKYFKEIIFPPKQKQEERFDINNKPVIISPKKQIDFWFIDVKDLATKSLKTELVAACPECDTSFVIRSDVKNKEIMKHALQDNAKFYIDYVKNHCPYCYPGNPIKESGGNLW